MNGKFDMVISGNGMEKGEKLRGPGGEFVGRSGSSYGIYRFVKPGVLKRLGKYKSKKEAEDKLLHI